MPQIGPLEILIVGVIALIVFGPEKLPEMARSVGKGVVQLKRMASDVKSEFDLSLHEEDEDEVAAEGAETDQAATTDAAASDADPTHSGPQRAGMR